jgi:cyclic pyranopterin phosphate synthase
MELTHLDEKGRAKMVDVSAKALTQRESVASGKIYMKAATLSMAVSGSMSKGDVFSTARIAGIMAAKRTHEIIPMCHSIPLDSVVVDICEDFEKCCIDIKAKVKCTWKTGVEMEALTAVSVAAMTIYDMCKAVDKEMTIGEIMLIKKRGGKSGVYERAAR